MTSRVNPQRGTAEMNTITIADLTLDAVAPFGAPARFGL
jgi:hypothetical protein